MKRGRIGMRFDGENLEMVTANGVRQSDARVFQGSWRCPRGKPQARRARDCRCIPLVPEAGRQGRLRLFGYGFFHSLMLIGEPSRQLPLPSQ